LQLQERDSGPQLAAKHSRTTSSTSMTSGFLEVLGHLATQRTDLLAFSCGSMDQYVYIGCIYMFVYTYNIIKHLLASICACVKKHTSMTKNMFVIDPISSPTFKNKVCFKLRGWIFPSLVLLTFFQSLPKKGYSERHHTVGVLKSLTNVEMQM